MAKGGRKQEQQKTKRTPRTGVPQQEGRMGIPGMPGIPSTRLKKTAAEALEELKAKQEGLATRNKVRDQFGSLLDDPNFRVEINGKEATGLKSGGAIRGYGRARGGKPCKMV